MKPSKSSVQVNSDLVVSLRFEEQRLNSFAGLTIFQQSFAKLGFNEKKKDQRRDHPLFCTLAQTGRVVRCPPASGQCARLQGAEAFLGHCFGPLWQRLPGARVESRMDSALFNEDMNDELDAARVDFTASVPFERLPELETMIGQRKRWRRVDAYEECPAVVPHGIDRVAEAETRLRGARDPCRGCAEGRPGTRCGPLQSSRSWGGPVV